MEKAKDQPPRTLCYSAPVRELLRKNARFFLFFTAIAFLLRLFFIWKFRFVAGDSFVYGDIARNWMQHGSYAVTEDGARVPTLIRLPGYPLFLVAVWSIAGIEHYTAVMLVQMFVEAGTCFVVAEMARETAGQRAAKIAFALCACCIFLANYVATPLTETLATFSAALALMAAVKGLKRLRTGGWLRWWLLCGLATAAGVVLRPDGGILLAALGVYLFLWMILVGDGKRILAAGMVVAAIGLAPLVPWTLRNQRALHVFQPLAPRFANNPNEYAPVGFYKWARTWIVEYMSVEDVYWHVPGEEVDVRAIPPRAFDSAAQRQWTYALFRLYNQNQKLTPELDAQFRALAEERIREHPLRYYVELPALRVLDMWLRPRTEALPINSRWWEFRDDPRSSAIGLALGAANLALIVLAILGAVRGNVRFAGLMLVWLVLRSAFLSTLENPEPRYVLECYPAIFVFAAAVFQNEEETSTQGTRR